MGHPYSLPSDFSVTLYGASHQVKGILRHDIICLKNRNAVMPAQAPGEIK